jgi:hypothetical protein
MASRTFILLAGHDAPWRVAVDARVADVLAEPGEPIDRVAPLAAESLRRAGYRGEPVLLAIPSAWCACASIALDGLPRRGDRTARLFRLEEKLPLATEDVVADFIDAGDRSLGVAALVERLHPVVNALESNGIAVESIAPTALLAARLHAPRGEASVVRIDEDSVTNLITFRERTPVAWSAAPASDVEMHVQIARHASGATDLLQPDEPLISAAVRAGRDALRGRHKPWIELRRDALASPDRLRASRRALNAALATAAVMLVAIGATFLVRANRYAVATREAERKLADHFQAEFPGWAVPANVGAVIDSEHRKLAAQQLGAARQASAESALRTLVRVLGALPAGGRVALERMVFDDRGFVLEGRVAAPAELDAITASIRAADLRVAPPQAQRDDGGRPGTWRFTLRGELAGGGGPAPVSASATPLAEVGR